MTPVPRNSVKRTWVGSGRISGTNDNDNLTSIEYPFSGRVIAYDHDAANRETATGSGATAEDRDDGDV